MNRQGEVWSDTNSIQGTWIFLVVGPSAMTLGGHMHPALNLETGERFNVHELLWQPFEQTVGYVRLA